MVNIYIYFFSFLSLFPSLFFVVNLVFFPLFLLFSFYHTLFHWLVISGPSTHLFTQLTPVLLRERERERLQKHCCTAPAATRDHSQLIPINQSINRNLCPFFLVLCGENESREKRRKKEKQIIGIPSLLPPLLGKGNNNNNGQPIWERRFMVHEFQERGSAVRRGAIVEYYNRIQAGRTNEIR
ncbi:hypothetical protein HOY80DRAFT_501189 [Tuber brumale]|nr:hypothetical protein HOY80DRAFT_501189 [Tuber brumale]